MSKGTRVMSLGPGFPVLKPRAGGVLCRSLVLCLFVCEVIFHSRAHLAYFETHVLRLLGQDGRVGYMLFLWASLYARRTIIVKS